jgi:1-deoxy-D-xylulose-5-phosphate synthase
LSDALIEKLLSYKNVLFFEEGILNGGIAEKCGFKLLQNGFSGKYKAQAVEGFVKQATVDSQRKKYGLDSDSIAKTVKEVLSLEQ